MTGTLRASGTLARWTEIQKTREVPMLPRVDVDEARAGFPVGVGGDGDMIWEMLESMGVASMQINAVKAQHA
jgi:hypothetical protein